MLRFTGADGRSTIIAVDETSQPIELLLSVSRDGARTLGAQIEDRLRRSIRDGSLHPGARVPSTRDLARQLGVSRRVVVDAYAQLAAEGYLSLRQGARPRVSDAAAVTGQAQSMAASTAPRARFDFRPSVPDVSTFPRAAWLRSLRYALAKMIDAELGYGDPRGVEVLRCALAEYLGRVRGVAADPECIIITSGYTQGLGLVCHALAAGGATRIALEDPSNPEDGLVAARAGLEPVPIGVDGAGTRVDELEHANADAIVVTPAHQHPTGVVLTGERRTALLAWLRPTRSRSRTTTTRSTATTARRSGRSRDSTPTGSSTPAQPAKHSRRDSGSGGWSYPRLSCPPSATRSSSPTAGPPASNSTHSPTSSPVANSTATCGACEPITAAGVTR
jgi:DNA-binding transcriptional regulator YhcF (GntR family)